MKLKIVPVASIAISVLASLIATAGPADADRLRPKRGDCYMYTNVDIAPISAKKDSVSCSQLHNQETYRVATWPSNQNPYTMSDAKRQKVASKLCLPFRGESSYFNYFNFYLPTKQQWDDGARWLRCDAAIKVNEGSPNVWESWRGQILDIR